MCTFSLAYLCQCSFPLNEIIEIPGRHTALQVIWLANTSTILVDTTTNPRIMSTIEFRKMMKIQFELSELLMLKDTKFHQMLTAQLGRFSFISLNGKNLYYMILCQQNSCILQLHTHFTTMINNEISILGNFRQLNSMVLETGHYNIKPQSTSIVEVKNRTRRSMFK